LTLEDGAPKPAVTPQISRVAIRVENPTDLKETVQRLEARVQALESLYGLVDLLALPGLLAGGAVRIFDSLQTAETIAAQAPGFYGREAAGRGVTIRWTRFPEPARLDIAVLGSIPFRIELAVLHTPHVSTADDVVLLTSDGERIAFDQTNPSENGLIEFGCLITRPDTGLLSLFVSSRTSLEGSGGDSRQLGLPFVHLRSRPHLTLPATD
jgi:hypothetical protein